MNGYEVTEFGGNRAVLLDRKPKIQLGPSWSTRDAVKSIGLENLRLAPVLRSMDELEIEQLVYGGKVILDKDRLVPVKRGGSRQYWQETLAWATAAGTSINNTTTETAIYPDVTIPGNYMQDGRGLAIRAMGEWSTLGSGTVTVIFRYRWGGVAGTVLCASSTIVLVISIGHGLWSLDVEVQTRTNGSTGTLMANGVVHVFAATAPTVGSATGSPAEGPMTAGGQTTPAVATVDLTADAAFSMTAQMGAPSTSNIVIGHNYTIKSLN